MLYSYRVFVLLFCYTKVNKQVYLRTQILHLWNPSIKDVLNTQLESNFTQVPERSCIDDIRLDDQQSRLSIIRYPQETFRLCGELSQSINSDFRVKLFDIMVFDDGDHKSNSRCKTFPTLNGQKRWRTEFKQVIEVGEADWREDWKAIGKYFANHC